MPRLLLAQNCRSTSPASLVAAHGGGPYVVEAAYPLG